MNIFRDLILLILVFFLPVFSYTLGLSFGEERANKTLWETPPDMAYCVVYQDGGKRCEKKIELPPVSLSECIRQCRGKTRMEKIK